MAKVSLMLQRKNKISPQDIENRYRKILADVVQSITGICCTDEMEGSTVGFGRGLGGKRLVFENEGQDKICQASKGLNEESKKKKSKKLPWILIILGGVIVIAGIIVGHLKDGEVVDINR